MDIHDLADQQPDFHPLEGLRLERPRRNMCPGLVVDRNDGIIGLRDFGAAVCSALLVDRHHHLTVLGVHTGNTEVSKCS